MGTSVGMIGLGIMGSAMASSLLDAGFRVIGYDVMPARRKALSEAGGKAVLTAAHVARRADIVITSLPSAAALETVVSVVAASRIKGLIVIETSTLPLEAKQSACTLLSRNGVTLLDCPLSGTGAQARRKDLVVYASGSRAACRRCEAIFHGFARAHYYLGAFGAGSKMKYIANHLVAIHNVAAGEAMTLARKAGLDPAQVLRVIDDGAGSSRMFQLRGPMMAAQEYSNATMRVDLWQKDMRIIADFASRLSCPMPLFSSCVPIYDAAMALGYAKQDTASVCAVLEHMAGRERRPSRVHHSASSDRKLPPGRIR